MFSLETLQFYKAISGIRELLRSNELESINPALMIRVVRCFSDKFIEDKIHDDDPNKNQISPTTAEDF